MSAGLLRRVVDILQRYRERVEVRSPRSRASGGIGRRDGFRFHCPRTWGFKSPLAHWWWRAVQVGTEDEHAHIVIREALLRSTFASASAMNRPAAENLAAEILDALRTSGANGISVQADGTPKPGSERSEPYTLTCPFCQQTFTVSEHKLPPHEPPPGSNAPTFRASKRCFGSGNRLGVRTKRRACEVCGRIRTVLDDGQLSEHTHAGRRCPGGRTLPSAAGADVQPVSEPPVEYQRPPIDEPSGNSVRAVLSGLPSTGKRRR
jgi:hypothetical protein